MVAAPVLSASMTETPLRMVRVAPGTMVRDDSNVVAMSDSFAVSVTVPPSPNTTPPETEVAWEIRTAR